MSDSLPPEGEPRPAVYGPNFRRLAATVRERNPTCQFCGGRDSTDAHHWALQYPSDANLTENDLTALCAVCHAIATEIRRFERAGGDVWDLLHAFKKGVEECGIKSPLRELPHSLSTTARPDSTRTLPSSAKSPKSRRSGERTEQKLTSSGLSNLNVSTLSISTQPGGRPSLPPASEHVSNALHGKRSKADRSGKG